jgi:hypothetical protein
VTTEERESLVRVHQILWEFAGAQAWEKAGHAVEHIEWLRRELANSQYNEKAFMLVLEQERAELFALRSRVRLARECMQANDPTNARVIFGALQQGDDDEHTARQASGTAGAK